MAIRVLCNQKCVFKKIFAEHYVASAILYREVTHMLHTRIQPNWHSRSGEEVVRMVFTIYGHDDHLEFRIMALLARSCITIK